MPGKHERLAEVGLVAESAVLRHPHGPVVVAGVGSEAAHGSQVLVGMVPTGHAAAAVRVGMDRIGVEVGFPGGRQLVDVVPGSARGGWVGRAERVADTFRADHLRHHGQAGRDPRRERVTDGVEGRVVAGILGGLGRGEHAGVVAGCDVRLVLDADGIERHSDTGPADRETVGPPGRVGGVVIAVPGLHDRAAVVDVAVALQGGARRPSGQGDLQIGVPDLARRHDLAAGSQIRVVGVLIGIPDA